MYICDTEDKNIFRMFTADYGSKFFQNKTMKKQVGSVRHFLKKTALIPEKIDSGITAHDSKHHPS